MMINFVKIKGISVDCKKFYTSYLFSLMQGGLGQGRSLAIQKSLAWPSYDSQFGLPTRKLKPNFQ